MCRCWVANAKNASVLIIGGGDGGILRESLKHDFVTSVTMVEIDQRVIDLASEYLAVNGDYDDPRVTLVIDNAANFVSQALKDGKRYDLIVLDLTEPVGPSSCLFTEKFLTEVVSLVSETGVILDSDSIYLSKNGGDFLQEVSGERRQPGDGDAAHQDCCRISRSITPISRCTPARISVSSSIAVMVFPCASGQEIRRETLQR